MTTRRHMPDERHGLTHRFQILGEPQEIKCPHCDGVVKVREKGIKGYITTGLHEDGTLGEIFITLKGVGSAWRGFMDCFALAVSLCLQYGVPLKVLCSKFINVRFEPLGYVKGCAEIKQTSSVVSYVFQWLELKYLPNKKENTP